MKPATALWWRLVNQSWYVTAAIVTAVDGRLVDLVDRVQARIRSR